MKSRGLPDLTGEQLWLLDEGHCFRDQLEAFCQLKAARASQLAYHLGSMETFMRMVESGKVTFIPGTGCPATGTARRKNWYILLPSLSYPANHHADQPSFIRKYAFKTIAQEVTAAVPKEMLS